MDLPELAKVVGGFLILVGISAALIELLLLLGWSGILACIMLGLVVGGIGTALQYLAERV
jgi:hypothetical protein